MSFRLDAHAVALLPFTNKDSQTLYHRIEVEHALWLIERNTDRAVAVRKQIGESTLSALQDIGDAMAGIENALWDIQASIEGGFARMHEDLQAVDKSLHAILDRLDNPLRVAGEEHGRRGRRALAMAALNSGSYRE